MSRYARATDANHASIRDGLRKLGFHVLDLSRQGDGCPDLCVYSRRMEAPVWLELKVRGGKLNAVQRKWHETNLARGVRVACVRSLDEALAVLIGEGARRVDETARAVLATTGGGT